MVSLFSFSVLAFSKLETLLSSVSIELSLEDELPDSEELSLASSLSVDNTSEGRFKEIFLFLSCFVRINFLILAPFSFMVSLSVFTSVSFSNSLSMNKLWI